MSNLRRKIIFLVCQLLIVYGFPAGAQTTRPTNLTPPIPDGSLIWQRLNVQSTPEIADLLKMQYDQNRKIGTTPGYRLQLYFGSGVQARGHAEKVKGEFSSLHPTMRVYLSFKSPDFIVRAGDFRTKSEALKVLRSLPAAFSGAFIVSDDVYSMLPVIQAEIK